jgi:hypothetical protein
LNYFLHTSVLSGHLDVHYPSFLILLRKIKVRKHKAQARSEIRKRLFLIFGTSALSAPGLFHFYFLCLSVVWLRWQRELALVDFVYTCCALQVIALPHIYNWQ